MDNTTKNNQPRNDINLIKEYIKTGKERRSVPNIPGEKMEEKGTKL